MGSQKTKRATVRDGTEPPPRLKMRGRWYDEIPTWELRTGDLVLLLERRVRRVRKVRRKRTGALVVTVEPLVWQGFVLDHGGTIPIASVDTAWRRGDSRKGQIQ